MIPHLEEAKQYGSELQGEILSHYVDYYKTGLFKHFKKSQIKWVQDEDPNVDTNFGFQIYYNDPIQIRGEFLCFTMLLDAKLTPILKKLVQNAENFLKYLPWSSDFEKDKYEKPKFIAVDVL